MSHVYCETKSASGNINNRQQIRVDWYTRFYRKCNLMLVPTSKLCLYYSGGIRSVSFVDGIKEVWMVISSPDMAASNPQFQLAELQRAHKGWADSRRIRPFSPVWAGPRSKAQQA